MNSKEFAVSDDERTEAMPAQEKVAASGEQSIQLTAEQVYAQRLSETPRRGSEQTQGFVP